MSTHNIFFHGEIRKILSVAISVTTEAITYVLMFRSQTSTAPSLTHANTVDDLGDHAIS